MEKSQVDWREVRYTTRFLQYRGTQKLWRGDGWASVAKSLGSLLWLQKEITGSVRIEETRKRESGGFQSLPHGRVGLKRALSSEWTEKYAGVGAFQRWEFFAPKVQGRRFAGDGVPSFYLRLQNPWWAKLGDGAPEGESEIGDMVVVAREGCTEAKRAQAECVEELRKTFGEAVVMYEGEHGLGERVPAARGVIKPFWGWTTWSDGYQKMGVEWPRVLRYD